MIFRIFTYNLFIITILFKGCDFLKIGVLCGGNSSEHEISIISALDLLKRNNDYKFLYLTKENEIYYIKNPTIDNILSLKGRRVFFNNSGFKGIKLDFVILTVHGKNAEDVMGGILDFYKIPYLGSSIYPSIMAMDKELTYLKLKQMNIDTLDKIVLHKGSDFNINKYPVIIKPARSGSSIGINVVHNREDAVNWMNTAYKEDNKIIIEPFIENMVEFCVGFCKDTDVIMSRVEVIHNQKEFFDYDEKYKNRKEDFKHDYLSDDAIIDKIYQIGKTIYNNFEFEDIIRIDFIYSNDKLYVNEINSIPGSLGLYLFEDKNLLDKLIKNKYRVYYQHNQIKKELDRDLIGLNSKK